MKSRTRPIDLCYACDAPAAGVAWSYLNFQGVAFAPRPACAGRHAWPRKSWPEGAKVPARLRRLLARAEGGL